MSSVSQVCLRDNTQRDSNNASWEKTKNLRLYRLDYQIYFKDKNKKYLNYCLDNKKITFSGNKETV